MYVFIFEKYVLYKTLICDVQTGDFLVKNSD